jgi:putative transposase
MPDYRRIFVPGGEYFFTVNLEDRTSDVLVRRIDALRTAWRYVEVRAPFETVAAVVLPDHLHCIWRLPSDDDDFSTRWRLLKAHWPKRYRKAGARASAGCGSAGSGSMSSATIATGSRTLPTSTTIR